MRSSSPGGLTLSASVHPADRDEHKVVEREHLGGRSGHAHGDGGRVGVHRKRESGGRRRGLRRRGRGHRPRPPDQGPPREQARAGVGEGTGLPEPRTRLVRGEGGAGRPRPCPGTPAARERPRARRAERRRARIDRSSHGHRRPGNAQPVNRVPPDGVLTRIRGRARIERRRLAGSPEAARRKDDPRERGQGLPARANELSQFPPGAP